MADAAHRDAIKWLASRGAKVPVIGVSGERLSGFASLEAVGGLGQCPHGDCRSILTEPVPGVPATRARAGLL